MGHLRNFKIEEIQKDYNIKCFVETGTGYGKGLEYALESDFDKLYSIEYHEMVYHNIKNKFKDERLSLINNSSSEALKELLPTLDNEPILFWLDAHFPGADFGFGRHIDEKDEKLRIPLEEEIEIISKYRKDCNDYFLIDDLRIYEDGNFKSGNWSERRKFGGDGIDFIYKNLPNHNITKSYDNEGYIICIPKNKK